ncbi:hypothetical protein MYAM1_001290 [Malassezia yamatoensis]|uniref:Integral membrane protein n=1 Tax=Malassezia yamatoensis TaxID=253288 RepID=A0AAJ6CGT3_9BASI|nr:hypothetical protein MYAM1_001290 [Malassezia yamatoensis]
MLDIRDSHLLPPPTTRLQRSRANSSSSVLGRSSSWSERSSKGAKSGNRRPSATSQLDHNEDSIQESETSLRFSRGNWPRWVPGSRYAHPDEETPAISLSSFSRNESRGTVSETAPRGILYPGNELEVPAMEPSSSHHTTASAPAAAVGSSTSRPRLTIAEPVPSRSDDAQHSFHHVDQNLSESSAYPRRGSLAVITNAVAAMNPFPRMTSMWPGARDDDDSYTMNSSQSNGGENLTTNPQQESTKTRQRSATLPTISRWRSNERQDKNTSATFSEQQNSTKPGSSRDLHSDQMVDYLDVIDPAVGVFNTLQDFGNSTMLPNVPWFYNRRPTLNMNRIAIPNVRPQSPTSPSPTSPIYPTGDHQPWNSLHNWNHRSQYEDQDLEQEAESLGRAEIHREQAQGVQQEHEAEPPSRFPYRQDYGGSQSKVKPELSPSKRDSRLRPDETSFDDSWWQPSNTKPLADKAPSHKDSSAVVPETNQDHESSLPAQDSLTHKQSSDSFSEMEEIHTQRWWAMDAEERKELDHHIRHLLTNKSKARRYLKGFWNFVRTPMGFILTTYGLLITAWGMLIMLLIIPWVHFGDKHRQRYWIEICDQVLCALFTAVGLGFAPFRAVDTYRMAYIAHYHFVTYKRRRLLDLPKLKNKNELPRYSQGRIDRLVKSEDGTSSAPEEAGAEAKELTDPVKSLEAIGVKHARGGHAEEVYGVENLFGSFPGQPGSHPKNRDELHKQRLKRAPSIDSIIDKSSKEVSVLSPTEQANLQHQQRLFHASHTFYRYRETATHWPFPLRLMMVIVILLDCHSILQGTLGGVTWGIQYQHRPTALTATIITCSLSCNAMAGILIWQGGKRTRKTEVVKRRLKLALEERAIERMERKRRERGKHPSKTTTQNTT